MKNQKISLVTFIGMVMALCATVRSIPTLAAPGWTMLFWILFAVIFFAGPVSLMAGEMSTMLQDEGGPQLWVKTGLGPKWGFVESWLLWVQIFPGMVMVASTLWPLLASTIFDSKKSLIMASNNWYTLACILVLYWFVVILNLKFDMAKFGGSIGVWLGVYIPMIILLVMGLLSVIKVGIQSDSMLGGPFSFSKLFPDFTDMAGVKANIKYLPAIAFIFTGIETTSVYIPRLKDASKNFTRGLIIGLMGLIILNIINAFFLADAIKPGTIQLTNITQVIIAYCGILGWPLWIARVFSALAFIGVLLQLSAWVTGPSQTIVQVAREGLLPSKFGFHKQNNIGVAKNVILTQTTAISIFALLYALPNVNSVFLTLVNTTTLLYCALYILIAISYIRLRYTEADAPRPYRIGKSGNGAAWVTTIFFLFGILGISIVTILTTPMVQSIAMVVVTIVLFVVPLIINKNKDDQWLIDVQNDLKANK
ncbi:amino acid permease [Ligilactobacillus ceti]|uniref:Amino acid permease n=1 Tax=Ligilactobacillus ceti DSM 22408 TaxID=1122146 RepID=A0A0R2KS68_9LACO|nr:amino acid permease [Ligilactobacillus ceti]KRN89127.1 amino acid permease [Ligilactobacillus ceti DSM 22408]